MKKRWQKNLTVSKEQMDLIKANHKKISNREIAVMLGITYNKLHNNLRFVGLVKSKAKVVKMDGYFDEEAFFKHYAY